MYPVCISSRICFSLALSVALAGQAASESVGAAGAAASTIPQPLSAELAARGPTPLLPADDSALVPRAAAAPMAVPLADDPLAPAIAAALAQEARPHPAAAVYAARGHAPIWMAADASRREALIAALEDADSHALPVARYAPVALRAKAAAAGVEDRAAAELAFTDAFLRYARDLTSGLVEPSRVSGMIKRGAPRREPAALLRAASEASDMAAHLAALAPVDPDYAALRSAYADARAAAARAADAPMLPDGASIRPGERSARVATLRARLAARGFALTAAAEPRLYDDALVETVKAFQRSEGLDADGAVGRLTRAALNRDAGAEAAILAANLERVRWLNIDKGRRRIVVNLPEYEVTLYDGDAVLFRERTVIGTIENQTPEFSDEMEYMVLNPSWHVPSSIAIGEILPALQRDPFYLQNRNMQLVRRDGGPVPADPTLHDFSQYTPATFPYRIRQAPNDDNALGLVKFMFPNDYAIYLHDTPKKKLFERPTRAYSHGCVRVRSPLTLAELLVAPQETDPAAFVARVLATGRERYVNFEEHVPVHLLYRTVTVAEDGALRFHADVYGRDASLIEALRAAGLATPEA